MLLHILSRKPVCQKEASDLNICTPFSCQNLSAQTDSLSTVKDYPTDLNINNFIPASVTSIHTDSNVLLYNIDQYLIHDQINHYPLVQSNFGGKFNQLYFTHDTAGLG